MIKDVLLIIDPGHGGNETGACANGILEKNINLERSLILRDLAKQYFENVLITRDTDVEFGLNSRTAWVAQKASEFTGKTICISCHFNACDGKARGVETIYSRHSNPDLAESIAKRITVLGLPLRRVFNRAGQNGDYYAMHRLTGKAQTIISEPLFIDNAEDVKALNSSDFLHNLAQAELNGILDYLGVQIKSSVIEETVVHSHEQWKIDLVKWAHENNVLNDLDGWIEKINEPLPTWAVIAMLKNMYSKLKG